MENAPIVSPEWLVATRSDIKVNETMMGGWGVSPAPLIRGASFTDLTAHEMAVPVGESGQESAVRLHEMLHARLSPARVPVELLEQLGVSRASIHLAEEVRINTVGRYMSYTASESWEGGDTQDLSDGSEVGLAKSITERNDWQSALTLYLTTLNTDVHKQVKRRLRTVPEWKEALQVIDKQMAKAGFGYKDYADYGSIRRRFTSTLPHEYKWITKTKKVDEAEIPHGFLQYTMPLAEKIDEWVQSPPKNAPRGKKFVIGDANDEGKKVIEQSSEWEALRFGMTSLTETTSAFIGKRKRPAMVGKFPVRPDRLLTDPERRIFREVVRSNGGVVVFDCSGSMSVTHEDIHNCIKQFSGATIVVYTHRTDDLANAWVVARNGRMISEGEFGQLDLNHGNGVDGPILRWAIRQRKNPKDFILWVSDGQVTGKGDCSRHSLREEVAQLSLRYNIIGAEDSDHAIRLLQDMKRTGAMPRNSFCSVINHTIKYMKDK